MLLYSYLPAREARGGHLEVTEKPTKLLKYSDHHSKYVKKLFVWQTQQQTKVLKPLN